MCAWTSLSSSSGAGPAGEAAHVRPCLRTLCPQRAPQVVVDDCIASTQAQTQCHALYTAFAGTVADGRPHWGAQVCDIHGSERGRADAVHLLQMPQGALLRAALSEGCLGGPQSSVQAAAVSFSVLPGRGRALPVCHVHLAASDAGPCSAGAQPTRGVVGVAAGGAQAAALQGRREHAADDDAILCQPLTIHPSAHAMTCLWFSLPLPLVVRRHSIHMPDDGARLGPAVLT